MPPSPTLASVPRTSPAWRARPACRPTPPGGLEAGIDFVNSALLAKHMGLAAGWMLDADIATPVVLGGIAPAGCQGRAALRRIHPPGLVLAGGPRLLRAGEAWQFIQEGRIGPGGPFPLNSRGGNRGWGRIHGVPHVLECYLQLSGRAYKRQTADARYRPLHLCHSGGRDRGRFPLQLRPVRLRQMVGAAQTDQQATASARQQPPEPEVGNMFPEEAPKLRYITEQSGRK